MILEKCIQIKTFPEDSRVFFFIISIIETILGQFFFRILPYHSLIFVWEYAVFAFTEPVASPKNLLSSAYPNVSW